MQAGWFKFTRRRTGTGRRVFRMAPLHHHFELVGLGGGHDHRPVLDHRRDRRGVRDGLVLRRVHRQWLTPSSLGRTVLGLRRRAFAGSVGGAGAARARRAGRADRDAARPHGRPTASRPARAGSAGSTSCPTGSTWSSPRPGCGRTDPLLRPRRPRGIAVLRRGRAGLAAARPERRAVAGGHRHQRQDDDGAHAGVDAARRRPAGARGRQRRRAAHRRGRWPTSRTTCWRSSCPASSCTSAVRSARPPARSSTSRPTTSTGTARCDAYARPRRGSGTAPIAVGNADDPRVADAARDGRRGCRRVGFTLAEPAAGQLGVRDGILVDRAFGDDALVADRRSADVRPAGAHNVANALAAAALARAYGVGARRGRGGSARVRARPAPQPARRPPWTASLGRRQQGDQPARRRGVAARLRPRSSGSPAVSSRARRSTSWSREVRRRLRRRGAARAPTGR